MHNPSRRLLQSLLGSVSIMTLPSVVLFLPLAAQAQEAAAAPEEEVIIVTGTRREVSVQDVPLNITAIGAAQINDQGIDSLTELAASVAGLHIIDQGGHSANPIIVRGLNADPVNSNDGVTDAGGTVGVYYGDIPLLVDLRLKDIERVEVLLGPQGTLYGSGTLGGAIRFIPTAPKLGRLTAEVRGDMFGYKNGSVGTDTGITVNLPLGTKAAFRGSIDRLEDNGFIDYNHIVKEIGVSDPDPDYTNGDDVNANIVPERDANDVDILSGSLALKIAPTDSYSATLSYVFQNSWVGGRQISGEDSTIATPRYVSPKRVRETFERNIDMIALEQTLGLDFAELTSSTGYTRLLEDTRRDQTDLLLLLNPSDPFYYYENFPTFTAFTRDVTKETKFSQEFRLTSTGDGPFTWLGGVFYARTVTEGDSKEFTPFLSDFYVDNFGAFPRPDGLEYVAVTSASLVEMGAFGEVGWDVTEKLNITLGGRYFDYDLKTVSATDFPLLNTSFDPLVGPNDINLSFGAADQADRGFLWKANASYDFTDDVMGYFTRSEGFRIGNSNGLSLCDPTQVGQTVCASGEKELAYQADTTTNYELGLRSEWFDRALTLNLATYYIEWDGPQVSSATLIGGAPITINGEGATSRGFEVNFKADLGKMTIRGSYANNDSQLSADSVDLITVSNSANDFLDLAGEPEASFRIDGKKGDRLPGSPQHQGSLAMVYDQPLTDGVNIKYAFGATGMSGVSTRTGNRGGGVRLPSYVMVNGSVAFEGPEWTMTFYAKNMLDAYVRTGAVGTPLNNYTFTDDAGGPVNTRAFYYDVAAPRTLGIKVSRKFGG